MAHAHVTRDEPARPQQRRRMAIVLGLTLVYLIVELVASWMTGSLALLADAGHMITDAGGVGLSLFAMIVADRQATPERTYGFHRAEILAAMANGVVLLGISAFVLFEAVRRFASPPEIASPAMVAVASVGLAVNLAGVFLLRGGADHSLNVKAAYFEVMTDAITSLGVIAAGVVMWTTGWYLADPVLSALIGVLIVPRVWRLLREAVGVLLEGTPADVDLAALRTAMRAVPGVAGVHDLHVWTLTAGRNAMSAHVVTARGEHDEVRQAVEREVTAHFRISHVTLQVEGCPCGQADVHD